MVATATLTLDQNYTFLKYITLYTSKNHEIYNSNICFSPLIGFSFKCIYFEFNFCDSNMIFFFLIIILYLYVVLLQNDFILTKMRIFA